VQGDYRPEHPFRCGGKSTGEPKREPLCFRKRVLTQVRSMEEHALAHRFVKDNKREKVVGRPEGKGDRGLFDLTCASASG